MTACAWNIPRRFISANSIPAASSHETFVYNWLKDFVDVTATPDELASRLALSGTNIGGIENGSHGAVIDAEVTSNRPDCLSHYGIAREVGALYKTPAQAHFAQARENPRQKLPTP